MGGACGAPRLLGIYLISKMHTKTIQKIQKAYIKTYEKDVKIYKDIENSQGTLLLQKWRPLYLSLCSFFNICYKCLIIYHYHSVKNTHKKTNEKYSNTKNIK